MGLRAFADGCAAFMGDVARPFAIISTAGTTAWAIVDPATGSDKLTAAGLILAALYGAKAVEQGFGAKKAAEVEVAKVTHAPTATAPLQDPATAGEKPPSERLEP